MFPPAPPQSQGQSPDIEKWLQELFNSEAARDIFSSGPALGSIFFFIVSLLCMYMYVHARFGVPVGGKFRYKKIKPPQITRFHF